MKPKSVYRYLPFVERSSSDFRFVQQTSDVAFYLERRTPEFRADWTNRGLIPSWKVQYFVIDLTTEDFESSVVVYVGRHERKSSTIRLSAFLCHHLRVQKLGE